MDRKLVLLPTPKNVTNSKILNLLRSGSELQFNGYNFGAEPDTLMGGGEYFNFNSCMNDKILRII